jgi:PAS domain S-box-containing protein
VTIQGLLAKVFVSVQAAVAVVTEDGVIAMANPALDQFLGYSPGGLVGKPSMQMAAPAARSILLQARQRQIENGQDYKIETSVIHTDGSEIRVELASILVAREDLKRFRILTLTPLGASITPPILSVRVAGKIKLIGLEEVKASLGSRWPAVATRAMQTAEHIVKRRCGPRDSWSRTDDSGFVILFGDATEEEAALRAATIARDIRIRLIGEGQQQSTACVSAITRTVDLPDQPGRSPDMLAAAIDQRLNAHLVEIEGHARDTLRLAVENAACKLNHVRCRNKFEIVGDFATLPPALEQSVQSALLALPSSDRETFDYDRFVLVAAAAKLIEKIAVSSSLPVLVPVDFEIFMNRRRTERYIAACQALDGRLQQILVPVLSNLPHGVPTTRVHDCVMRLRPFCRMVAFKADGLQLPPVESSSLGGSIVTLEEGDLDQWSPDDLARLESLILGLHAQRARVLVRSVSSLANAKRLLQLGVDLISLADDCGPRS